MCVAVQDLTDLVSKLTVRVSSLEKGSSGGVAAAPVVTPAPAAKEEPQDDDEEDDFELFDGNEVLQNNLLILNNSL